MNELVVDPKTGFLTGENLNSFGVERKQRMLEVAEKHIRETGKWPDMASLCDALGIGTRTLERHLKADKAFASAFRELTLRGKWKLESAMYDLAVKSPLYMFGWLRKWFPEEYNPEHKITVQHGQLAQTLDSEAGSFVDAQIVEPGADT